ncbi:hypothetical protein D3C77_351950 [compost metagenome]
MSDLNSDEEKKDKLNISDLVDPSFPERLEVVQNITESIAAILSRPEIPVFLASIEKALVRIAPPAIKFLSEFGGFALKMIEANNIRTERYPKVIECLDFLAAKTWFVSMSLGLSNYERLAFSPETIGMSEEVEGALNDLFIEVYRESLDDLEASMLDRFPKRAFAIGPAINAHRRGEFALSIPVFLSQADGILLDITSAELFTSKGHISKHAQSQISTEPHENWLGYFDDAKWSPLSVVRPIGWSPKERSKEGYDGLNRHTIMHGMDLNYASEVNSYKSLSLLVYIASLGSDIDEEEQGRL